VAEQQQQTGPKPELDDLLELRHQARALGLASNHLVNTTFSGLYASVFRGSGLDFDEVREYREGDDVRNIEWNVTARTNSPHLKIFREERERNVFLCIDQGAHMNFGTRNTFKSVQAARAGALLGWAANNLHDRVGGMLFGNPSKGPQYFRPTRGRRALWRLLNQLSEPTEKESVGCLTMALQRVEKGAGTGSLIFVIADFNQDLEDLDIVLGRLSLRHSVILLPVDDPADRQLPDMGKVTFHNAEGNVITIDTSSASGRKAYEDAWHERRNKLRAMAARLGIAVIPLSTDEDVHLSVTRGLKHRASQQSVR
jgi:uncharacterized protein (DUF58 family)